MPPRPSETMPAPARGRISDEAMTGTTKLIFLILARGVTQGATQARLETELKKLLRATPAPPARA